MKRLLVLTAAAGALAIAANADTRTYDVGSFTELDTSRGVKVVYKAGETQSIRAETEQGDLDKLKIEVDGDRLIVSRHNNGLFNRSNRRDRFTVYITSPAISAIEASSGSSVDAEGLAGEDVSLSVSSGSRVDAKQVQATNVTAGSSSGASLDIAGECQALEAKSSSGSSIEADRLACLQVEASASSGSSIEAHASLKAFGKASSGASVEIEGGAEEVDRQKSSGGSVRIS